MSPEKQAKVIEAYAKVINNIDDLLEYRWRHYTAEEVRNMVLDEIDKGAKNVEKIFKGEQQ